ncbi:UDP-N-acetylmuramoyl-L-alanine--D-glutamate ligase [Sporosarcina sp. G11-34]|uniref:UDP-N-acetylmuramoyl-L-alanine--D-glutamate ligase n=1 Tax=Sporosarcina sp. G11-34 TaxID=2849605 RepID=UPI0022A95702|nr:UDP-N-acetylmuramoyl-L-alanine--D-glutamate ligase [Sporosarcina sp. G11-34]MCZ2257112.1 UDP-N-acetylmuramoyl-L-alanine--D-glutamate ligase [Sporosarcina sp. G11-34]
MKNTEQFKHKKILVLGLAKSGYAAAKLLHSLGAVVTVNDSSPEEGNEEAAALRSENIHVICGGHPPDLLEEDFSLVIKNPGIPYSNPIIVEAIEKGIPVWTEIELAYRISEAPIIGITGSNGKTTTTTILFHMLSIGHKKPLIAGNIGTVSCEVAEKAKADEIIVLEASSFQLMGIEKFRPNIAIITNIYDAHLDYHGTSAAYAAAKAAITSQQREDDFLIYNADQDEIKKIAMESKAILIPFSVLGMKEIGISVDETYIYWNGVPFIKRSFIKLPGLHNLENILSATAAAILSGCDKEAIENVLSSFTGVRHRMQYVKELRGRKYYNDSKATNTLATKSALAAFDAPTILIAGGLDRGHSFEELRPFMGNVKAVVTIGETKERLSEFATSCGVEEIVYATTMENAVQLAHSLSEEKDIILLSPASASWDQYASFEIRGDEFIKAVLSLKS